MYYLRRREQEVEMRNTSCSTQVFNFNVSGRKRGMQILSPNGETELGHEIAQGIRQRGFHMLFEKEVALICAGSDESPQQRAERIERFASRHHWVATVGCGALCAMIRKQEPKARVEAIWRRKAALLAATNQRRVSQTIEG
jgi:hypothetical protein